MKLLALDQATTTGFAVADTEGTIIESGIWRLADSKRSGESRGMRYIRFRTALDKILEKHPDIGLIVHEQTLLRGGAATEIANGLKALILETASRWCIEVSCVHSSELKKFATGKGNADKEEMVNAANLLSGASVVDDNEADAILIGLWASSKYGSFPAPKRANEKTAPKKRRSKKAHWLDQL